MAATNILDRDSALQHAGRAGGGDGNALRSILRQLIFWQTGHTGAATGVSAGSALTLTQAQAGRTILLDTAGGSTVTLPPASGSGMQFRFVITTVATSTNHIVKVANGADSMQGIIASVPDAAGAVLGWIATAGTSDTITLNRSTTGSTVKGEYIDVQDIAPNVWQVSGFTASTGTEVTPFSNTVA